MQIINNKYTTASTQITKAEIFAFIVVLVSKLLSCKVSFRDDTHMTSMKIAQFSRAPTPTVHLRPKLTLDVQF